MAVNSGHFLKHLVPYVRFVAGVASFCERLPTRRCAQCQVHVWPIVTRRRFKASKMFKDIPRDDLVHHQDHHHGGGAVKT